MDMLVSMVTGFLWTGVWLAFAGRSFAWRSAIIGCVVGVVYGFMIRPLRTVDKRAGALIALIGLYVTGSMLLATHGVLQAFSHPGWRNALSQAFIAIIGAPALTAFSLTFTGLVVLLWPLSFANHLLLWWCQRSGDPRAPLG